MRPKEEPLRLGTCKISKLDRAVAMAAAAEAEGARGGPIEASVVFVQLARFGGGWAAGLMRASSTISSTPCT